MKCLLYEKDENAKFYKGENDFVKNKRRSKIYKLFNTQTNKIVVMKKRYKQNKLHVKWWLFNTSSRLFVYQSYLVFLLL